MESTPALKSPAAAAAVAKVAPDAKSAAKKINEDTKGGLSWVAVGAVALFGFIVIRTAYNASKVGDIVGSGADAASAALDQITDVINDPEYNASDSPLGDAGQSVITITEVEAQNRANLLLEAMGGLGTNFQRVKEALNNITLADYVLISQEFGTPRYDGFGESHWPFPQRNLSYWIVAELDNSEIAQIRNMLPGLF